MLAQYDSGTWAYHLNDGLGSVRGLADPAGQVVASYSFSPFGVPLGESGGEPYGFTGEQWDASAGLVFLRARYYEPGTGRFTRRDPSRLEANLYLYASGNPINHVDPSGLLSNRTIAASFGMENFNDVLPLFAQCGDWGLLKLLQDAEVGDKIYAGKFNWTLYQGTIECYNVGDPLVSPSIAGYPYRRLKEGAVVLSRELFVESHTLSKLTGYPLSSPPIVNPKWYYRNNNYVEPAYTTKTNFGVLPDYVMVSGGGPLGELIGVPFLGGNFNVVVDRYGNIYLGGALDVSLSIPGLPSGSIVLGWLNQNALTMGDRWIPEPDELQRFIGGLGGGIAGHAIIGGGLAYNYELPPELFSKTLAGEVGIAIPTAGWTFLGRMWRITQKPWLEWDWVDKYPIEHGYGPMNIRMVDDRSVDCGCQ